jgi:hypothetical protein
MRESSSAVTSFLLLPGDLVCNAFGVSKANNRDLLRMLVNSFAWALVGAIVVVFAV